MNFADTNWLEAVYIEPRNSDREAVSRRNIVERFMRKHGGQLAISQIVLLEARNVFSRVTGSKSPQEWAELKADFDGKLYVDPMNWDLLRGQCERLFERYACKRTLGTFDAALVASAKLSGATCFLSFDRAARALARAEGIEVFPPLDAEGKTILAELRQ